MELKNNLKKKRFEHNQISQEELAGRLGVSRHTIMAIENGKFNPSVKLALMISNFFNCKVEEIFYLDKKE